jgi:hypothetical protein
MQSPTASLLRRVNDRIGDGVITRVALDGAIAG